MDRQSTAVKEHEALIDLIGQGDARAAEDLAVAHFEREGALVIDQHLALLTSQLEGAR
jgi:DNA-binding GntR family transcriptional regulator